MSQVTDPRVEHLLHPRHPAEVLRAMFDGRETTDYPAMATQAVLLLAERDTAHRLLADTAGYLAALHRHTARHDVLTAGLGCAGCALLDAIEAHMVGPDRQWSQPGTERWQWAESVSWTATGTVTVPIARRGVGGDVVMDAAQAGVLAEMLADAADQDAATEAKRAAQHAAADAIQDLTLEMTELPGGAS